MGLTKFRDVLGLLRCHQGTHPNILKILDFYLFLVIFFLTFLHNYRFFHIKVIAMWVVH